MKITVVFCGLIFCITSFLFAQNVQTLHNYNAVTISGDTISLAQYAGKKLMIVNTASYCGYTPQFTQLQQVYQQYHTAYNFEILGFPCNDFGNQDPGTDSAALNFCTSNYNVTFQMMSHVFITSTDTTDIYKWLQLQSLNGVANASVAWNFNKFLIDETGHWVAHYASQILPNDPTITNWITSPNITNTRESYPSQTFSIKMDKENSLVNFCNNNSEPFSINIYSYDGKLVKASANNLNIGQIDTKCIGNGTYVAVINSNKLNKRFKFTICN